MYGFEGTECKIDGCTNPVWPNKALGFCNRHYQRFQRGRMSEDGSLLPLPKKTKKCESCGVVFDLKKMERHVRWCSECRETEYKKIQTDNNHGVYRRGQNGTRDTLKEKYIKAVLNKIIKACERMDRHRPVIEMRKSRLTYSEIAIRVGCSKQNIHQICSKYFSNQSIHKDAETSPHL